MLKILQPRFQQYVNHELPDVQAGFRKARRCRDHQKGRRLPAKTSTSTEDEIVGWHQRLDRQESEQALEAGDGQGGRACRGPWGHQESDKTE